MLAKVYLIISPSGRKYVGSTKTTINQRWSKYFNMTCTDQTRLYNSLKKYGPEKHTFEVIWEGPLELMLKMEHLLGLEHNVLDQKKGMNCVLPGYDDVPYITSEETKKKRGAANKGRVHSKERNLKISESKKGVKRKPFTDEAEQNMSKAAFGKIQTEETKNKRSATMKGRIVSQETRDKISEKNKGKRITEEQRKKLSISSTGRKRSKESIDKSNACRLKKVICIETGEEFVSIKEASEKLSIHRDCISENIHGKTVLTRKGLSFKFS